MAISKTPSLLKSAEVATGSFKTKEPVIKLEVESTKEPSPLFINNNIFVLSVVCQLSPPTIKSSNPSLLKSYFAK